MAGDFAQSVDQAPGMDYAQHIHTASNVWKFTKILTVAVLAVVLMLGIGGVGHSWGLATLGMILTFITTVIGLARPKGDWKPIAAVSLLIVVLAVLFG